MPALEASRQPRGPSRGHWFDSPKARELCAGLQRDAIPELTRVFGHSGLYLRSSGLLPEMLSGNMLARVINLHRLDNALAGELRCEDAHLPFAPASLALVYAGFVLESSPDPAALLAECARVLKPEGRLLLLTLDPWSPACWRWAFRGVGSVGERQARAWIEEAGLHFLHRRRLRVHAGDDNRAWLPRSRPGMLWVATRREVGMTPLRAQPVGGLRPGVSTG
jgi:SAM-dependent methyltransferase